MTFMDKYEENFTSCLTDHLTSFAVLISYNEDQSQFQVWNTSVKKISNGMFPLVNKRTQEGSIFLWSWFKCSQTTSKCGTRVVGKNQTKLMQCRRWHTTYYRHTYIHTTYYRSSVIWPAHPWKMASWKIIIIIESLSNYISNC